MSTDPRVSANLTSAPITEEDSRPATPLSDSGAEVDLMARIAKAQTLAFGCIAIAGTPAAAYLASRAIDPSRLPDGQIGWHPESRAILFASRNAASDVVAVQRVFLNTDGTPKLDAGGRKVKRTNGALKGSAFTLLGDGADILVCDGPEDALSLWQATGAPALCAFGMSWSGLPIPNGASVVLVADNDAPGSAASKAVVKAIGNLVESGFQIKLTRPPLGVKDTNDLLREQGADAVRAMVAAAEPPGSVELGDGSIPFDHRAEIARLAKLTTLDYELERIDAAKRIGIRPAGLDSVVKNARHRRSVADEGAMFPDVEPWPAPVAAAELLDAIKGAINRFVVCSESGAAAVALWVTFTWLIDRVQVAPLLIISAPEKRCGKSQLLSLIGRLSYRPLAASNISPASVYRVIEAWAPTLLIDEADTFFRQAELQGIVNSGHTRELAYVLRNVGDDHEPTRFSTWGAKAIAGIGHLPETVTDRAVVIELRRKLPHEQVERLRYAEDGLFEQLGSKLARFAQDAGEIIGEARPNLPAELNDRAQDNWEPLLAIADYAAGHWPATARMIALQLSGISREVLSISAELLSDIRDILVQRRVDRIATEDLLAALVSDEERPWPTYSRGKPLTARNLAKLLGEYGIASSNQWFGRHCVKKGFTRAQFDEAFARYLPADAPGVDAIPLDGGEGRDAPPGLCMANPLSLMHPPPPQPKRLPPPPPLPIVALSASSLAHSGSTGSMAASVEAAAIDKSAESQAPSGIAGGLGNGGNDIML